MRAPLSFLPIHYGYYSSNRHPSFHQRPASATRITRRRNNTTYVAVSKYYLILIFHRFSINYQTLNWISITTLLQPSNIPAISSIYIARSQLFTIYDISARFYHTHYWFELSPITTTPTKCHPSMRPWRGACEAAPGKSSRTNSSELLSLILRDEICSLMPHKRLTAFRKLLTILQPPSLVGITV